MGWTKAEGRLIAAKIDTVRLSVREVMKSRRTKGTRNSLIFYVGCYVGRKLGWSASAKCNLFWGEGENHGWARIELAHDGRFKISQTHRGGANELASFYFKTQQHPLDGGNPHPAAVCKHAIMDGALLIKMPAWFWRTYEKKHPGKSLGRKRSTVIEDKPADKPVLILKTKAKSAKSELTSGLNGNVGV